ncbi:permease-like cell division protein FtsX [Nonomuraea guangzhouensis]|uniref:Permease-like cell division protein FtsX n=1 Tax=Nonomuraea guangzhouensis TaxID=1291555 RepID=A0ABW4G9D6_9ACTN|nr:permease-like cell division protein FtsX [Nonomuraea guangzhouensis]
MNSPMEDRLREALAEAGATVDTSTLRPLQSTGRPRVRVDFRLLAAAGAVVVAGAVTAAVLVSPGDEQRAAVANPPADQKDETGLTVFLCAKEVVKNPDCPARVTTEQTQAIMHALEATPKVEKILYVSQAHAYDSFRRDYADDKVLLDAIDATDLPPSFQVKLKPGADMRAGSVRETGADLKALTIKLKSIGGVSSITTSAEVAKAMDPVQAKNADLITVFLCKEHASQVSCGASAAPDLTKDVPKPFEDGKAITPAQRSALTKKIDTMPGVQSARFESRQEAYENFVRTYKGNKALVQATRPSDMPESFRLQMSSDADRNEVVGKLQRLPGVAQVIDGRCGTKRLAFYERYGLLLPDNKICAS